MMKSCFQTISFGALVSGGALALFSSWINELSDLFYRMVYIGSQRKRISNGETMLQLLVIRSSSVFIFFTYWAIM